MKISLQQLAKLQPIERVIIQSIDLALYRALVEHQGEIYWLLDGDVPLKRHSLMEMRELFEPFHILELVLRHESAYDEMVGQPPRESNMLEVSLGHDLYPTPKKVH